MMNLNNPLERVRDVIQSGMGQRETEGHTFLYINLDQLDPSPFQPRQTIDEPSLDELAKSIAQSGIIEPIVIRRKEDRYEIISGERRWHASQKLKAKDIPCVLRDVSDEEAFQLALAENIQRNDLTPLEEAIAFKRLLDMKIAKNQSEVGKLLGIRQQRVSDKMRLLELPKEVRDLFGNPKTQSRFTQKHGEMLARLENNETIRLVAKRVIEEKLSTRETSGLVKKLLSKTNKVISKKNQQAKPKRLIVSRRRHGFSLKLNFDKRSDSLKEFIEELNAVIEKLQKEFSPKESN